MRRIKISMRNKKTQIRTEVESKERRRKNPRESARLNEKNVKARGTRRRWTVRG